MKKVYTSESVFDGHPDKVCDRISDEILDAILKEDINGRVAVETAIKNNNVYILGEVTTTAEVDYSMIARRTLLSLGYLNKYEIIENISKQSPDIALGVDERANKKQGAGDQGMMFGYATNETKELIPAPLALAHKIAKRYKLLRENKYIGLFAPDGKCQVSYLYENEKPVEIQTIIVSAQTKRSVNPQQLEEIIKYELLEPIIGNIEDINILINPTGEFIIGGPEADAGLTGRKIIVDTYGGFSHHGGGAFSGKDTSKVDRSAAYYARYVAKSFVKAGLCEKCEIGVAYSIGVSEPVSVYIDTFGTGVISDHELSYLLKWHFNFSPQNIIEELELNKVKFSNLSAFGHVGRDDLNVKWEKVDKKAQELRSSYEKTKRTP
ncbi:MAG: methionine adenosyltransferase [Acholeplasmataceae bacterium]|jgi:S-adenosylmethionine synthetase